ncbi:linker histone H1 and H5 family protein [Dictyocaulus viviparus]|uniref:Linker histone H1 and H5 family protein n=1 Tax=Dictyocaulus viviparus TaxID=29172 RepID=A0A0D8XSE3_DICVI|nr:linker histone H1 and H5 family protein [Dictyocaulus viviparus]
MSAATATSPKVSKPKTTKVASSHPTYSAMIRKAVTELKDKSGSSKAAILKYVLSHYKLGDNVTKINTQLRTALKRGVIKGELKQVKGIGASGSFKLAEKKEATASKKTTVKKPASKVAKTVKRATKKPKAEKKTKSPKKAKTPKAKSAKKPVAKSAKPKTTKHKTSKTKKVKA